ncbi:MAG: DUF503 domain-containing protein [Phycisphaerales bacterium]
MVIAVLQFELLIPQSQSLKDKRRVVKSVKDRLHREHLVSVAEVAALDVLTVAVMGLSLVSRDARHAAQVLDRIESKLRTLRDAELGDTTRELIRGQSGQRTSGLGAIEEPGEPVWTEEELELIAGRAEEESDFDGGEDDDVEGRAAADRRADAEGDDDEVDEQAEGRSVG